MTNDYLTKLNEELLNELAQALGKELQYVEEFSIENGLKFNKYLKEYGAIYPPLIVYVSSSCYKELEEKYHVNPKNNSNSDQD